MQAIAQDVRYAVSILRRTRALTALVAVTLAIGIGATTTAFSVIQAVLLRPLPYAHPDRLVAVWDGHVREKGLAKVFASYRDFEIWKAHSRLFEQMAALTWATGDQVLTGHGAAQTVLAIPVSLELFPLLGVAAERGRTFERVDQAHGCALVLAHKYWQVALGAAADIVGRQLTLDERACTIVGVMPAAFEFYPRAADMWRLIGDADRPFRGNVGVFGWLKPGVSLEAAQAELTGLHRSPEGRDEHVAVFAPRVNWLQDEFTWLSGRNLRLTLIVLFVATGFVLLIACVNVANVLLVRSVARQRELALRAALGAGRWRLMRQLLVEGLLLSSLGGALGIGAATVGLDALRAFQPVELPPGSVLELDPRAVAFAAIVVLASALLVGLVPAWRASRLDVATALKGAGPSASDAPSRRRLTAVLVAAEIACSVALLMGASLLIDSVGRLGGAPLGFDPHGLLSASIRLPRTRYEAPAARRAFYDELVTRLARMPGTEHVALSTSFLRGGAGNALVVEGRAVPSPDALVPDVGQDSVSADYFRVMRVPLIRGRFFAASDAERSPLVAIVNETLARKYFPAGEPIGRRIKLGTDATAPWLTVVGLVGDQKGMNLYNEMSVTAGPAVYRPLLQTAPTNMVLMLRSQRDPELSTRLVRQVVASLAADVPVSGLETVEHRVARDLAQPRFRAMVLGAFAAVALLLAIVGLYGLLSHLVAQRRREIGIRLALGAPRRAILSLVVGQGLMLTGVGLVAGLVVASWLGRFISTMLYGVRPSDPTMLTLVTLSLGAAAVAATYLPARRAIRTDPVEALRHD